MEYDNKAVTALVEALAEFVEAGTAEVNFSGQLFESDISLGMAIIALKNTGTFEHEG